MNDRTRVRPRSWNVLPPGFETLRRHWEWSHATRAVLQIVALAALAWSVRVETPPAR